jgi:hypothetical protein
MDRVESGSQMDERPELHAISDDTAPQKRLRPDGTVRGVSKAACLEAYEMLEEIALRRHTIAGHRKAAQEAWRRITNYVVDEE